VAGIRCVFHRQVRKRQLKKLEKLCDGLLAGVDGLDMFDRAVREKVSRSTFERFAEHHLHRVEWRCPCGNEQRSEVVRRASESTTEG
jgi:hypothetical protein